MQPILITVIAALAGVPLALWLRQNLATLGYRNDAEKDLPSPGPRWWVVWAGSLALGSLAGAATLSHDPLAYLPLVPLAIAGPWLAAVDFDVLRVPNNVLTLAAIATMFAVVGIAVGAVDWQMIVGPAVAALLAGGVFAAVHFATRGDIGFGDVKLAAAIGLAVGPLGVTAAWLSVLVGSLAALVWARASRNNGPIPLGPWLLWGAWMASLVMAAPPV